MQQQAVHAGRSQRINQKAGDPQRLDDVQVDQAAEARQRQDVEQLGKHDVPVATKRVPQAQHSIQVYV